MVISFGVVDRLSRCRRRKFDIRRIDNVAYLPRFPCTNDCRRYHRILEDPSHGHRSDARAMMFRNWYKLLNKIFRLPSVGFVESQILSPPIAFGNFVEIEFARQKTGHLSVRLALPMPQNQSPRGADPPFQAFAISWPTHTADIFPV